MLYLGKVKSVSHRKAPPSFIDDVLEKFRAHNELEEQRTRQTSLPVHVHANPLLHHLSRMSKQISLTDIADTHEARHTFSSRLVDTKEEEETPESQSVTAGKNNTLAILKQTEEVLKSLSERTERRTVSLR